MIVLMLANDLMAISYGGNTTYLLSVTCSYSTESKMTLFNRELMLIVGLLKQCITALLSLGNLL